MNDKYLRPKEVAVILQVTQRTVINMIHDGKIRAVVISGKKRKSYRILSCELDRFTAIEYEKYED